MYKNIYLNTKKNANTKKKHNPQYKLVKIKQPIYQKKTWIPRVVILDNDECLGQFGIFSSFVSIAKMNYYLPINMDILKNSLIKYILATGCARPYLPQLFQLLKKLKQQNKIDKVVMYTSAPNKFSNGKKGYIYFLKDCLETYCGTPGLYDMVLHRNNIKARVSKCGATIKDIGNALLKNNNLRLKLFEKDKNIIKHVNFISKRTLMVDDKPKNITKRNGDIVGVKPYVFPVNLNNIYNCIYSIPNMETKLRDKGYFDSLIKDVIDDLQKFRYSHYDIDRDLMKVCGAIIKKYYPEALK